MALGFLSLWGIASTLLGAVFGGIIGVISGYFGGWLDLMTQRMMDILQGLPLWFQRW